MCLVCLDTGDVALLLLSIWSVGTEALLLIHLLIVACAEGLFFFFKLCCIIVISQDKGFQYAEEDIECKSCILCISVMLFYMNIKHFNPCMFWCIQYRYLPVSEYMFCRNHICLS